MPAQIIEDDSIGQALGMLYKGFAAGSDPKRKAEALALQSLINNRGAATQQIEIENINLMRKRQAENDSIKAIGADLEAGRSRIAPTVTAPAPDAEFVGPMPQMPNPKVAEFDQRLATARAIANNAILRGGSAVDAATGAWKALGLGQVYTQGLPTQEPGARELQTIIGGDIPRADIPLTEQQRVVMATEKANQEAALKQMEADAAMARERVQQQGLTQRQLGADLVAPENSTPILTPERRKALGLPDTGPVPVQRSVGEKETVETPGRPTLRGAGLPDPNAPAGAKPLFEGTGENQQAWNILNTIVAKHESGEPLTPADIRAYKMVKSALFPFKNELRVVNGQSMYVPIRTQMPRELAIPGLVDEADIIADGTPPRGPVVAPDTGVPGAADTASALPGGGAVRAGVSGVPGEVIDPGKQTYTAEEGKNVKFAGQMMLGDSAIDAIEKGGQMPSMAAGVASDLLAPRLGKYTKDLVRTDALKNYESAAISFLEPIIRERSGAAVLESEYSNYHDQFIPHPLDPPELRAYKANSRKEAVKVMREVAEGTPAKEILARVQERVGAAPQPVAKASVPEGTSIQQLTVGATERKAQIDARPDLSPDEKSKRKAAIDARLQELSKQPGVK